MGAIMARGLIVLLLMFWLPALQAIESHVGGQATSQGESALALDKAVSPAQPKAGKGKGASVFWIVLAVSLLFVLGSAMALNGLSGKRPPHRKGKDGGESGG